MTLGTLEWAQKNVNIAIGCPHNCRYCYAREMAVRYHRCTERDWPKMKLNRAAVDRDYRKVKLQNFEQEKDWRPSVMFPSSHDIVPEILNESIIVLRKLLDAGNDVLVVSKPHFSCVSKICETLNTPEVKNHILFRFTVGSTDDCVLRFWEPGAPNFIERYACLIYARQLGFKTSVSCEPYLSDPLEVYNKLRSEITDSFWVGKLSAFNRRVRLDGATAGQIARYVEPLKAMLTEDAVREIYKRMKSLPKVRFKDSIREVVNGG